MPRLHMHACRPPSCPPLTRQCATTRRAIDATAADAQDLYAAPDTIEGAQLWKLFWSYEQRTFSEYFRDGFVEGEDLIIASCADANDSMMQASPAVPVEVPVVV